MGYLGIKTMGIIKRESSLTSGHTLAHVRLVSTIGKHCVKITIAYIVQEVNYGFTPCIFVCVWVRGR